MSSETMMNPPGGVDSRHVMERYSLDLITVAQVLERENLQKAWKQVKANRGAPGVDGMTIEEFPEYAFTHGEEIRAVLLEGTYTPSPVKRVEIPKDSGGARPLGIPTVLDRVIQQAISQVLTPVFDPHFSQDSYGFRLNRSAHQAVRKVEKDVQEGYRIAVDIDLEKFFDNGRPRRADEPGYSASQRQGALAKTYPTNCGLSKKYLEDQGLVSLRALWIGIHYPATAR
jgi:RNA-directed DNA polymerase